MGSLVDASAVCYLENEVEDLGDFFSELCCFLLSLSSASRFCVPKVDLPAGFAYEMIAKP